MKLFFLIIGLIIIIFLIVGMVCLYCQSDGGEIKKTILLKLNELIAKGEKEIIFKNYLVNINDLAKDDFLAIRNMSYDELEEIACYIIVS
jgi:hypothetical protein